MFPRVSYQNSIMMACFVVGRVTDLTASSHAALLKPKVALLSFVFKTSTRPTFIEILAIVCP